MSSKKPGVDGEEPTHIGSARGRTESRRGLEPRSDPTPTPSPPVLPQAYGYGDELTGNFEGDDPPTTAEPIRDHHPRLSVASPMDSGVYHPDDEHEATVMDPHGRDALARMEPVRAAPRPEPTVPLDDLHGSPPDPYGNTPGPLHMPNPSQGRGTVDLSQERDELVASAYVTAPRYDGRDSVIEPPLPPGARRWDSPNDDPGATTPFTREEAEGKRRESERKLGIISERSPFGRPPESEALTDPSPFGRPGNDLAARAGSIGDSAPIGSQSGARRAPSIPPPIPSRVRTGESIPPPLPPGARRESVPPPFPSSASGMRKPPGPSTPPLPRRPSSPSQAPTSIAPANGGFMLPPPPNTDERTALVPPPGFPGSIGSGERAALPPVPQSGLAPPPDLNPPFGVGSAPSFNQPPPNIASTHMGVPQAPFANPNVPGPQTYPPGATTPFLAQGANAPTVRASAQAPTIVGAQNPLNPLNPVPYGQQPAPYQDPNTYGQPYPAQPSYGQPYAAQPPYGQPAPYGQPYANPNGPRVVSMKTPMEHEAEKQARNIPQVQLRNLSDVAQTPARPFGRLAPPRDARAAQSRQMQDLVIWGSVVVITASLVTLLIWLVAR